MSKEITSTVYGSAPWSDELLRVSGDVSRRRLPPEAEDQQRLQDAGEYIGTIVSSDIRIFGLHETTYSPDQLRTLSQSTVELTDTINEAPVTRWFDTNTFYRQPNIDGTLSYNDKRTATIGNTITLLSPYSFSKLATKSTGISNKTALQSTVDLYKHYLDAGAAPDSGVLFYEPVIPYEGNNPDEIVECKNAIEEIAEYNPDISYGVFAGFGNGKPLVKSLADDSPAITAIGFDATKTEAIGDVDFADKIVLAGIIDGANTLIQSDQQALSLLHKSEVQANKLSITHSVDLSHVPWPIAKQKIQQIGRIAATLRSEQ